MTLTNGRELTAGQQAKRLSLVIEGTRLGMWDWNPQTGEVAFNEIWAEMLGHDLDEIEPRLAEWESRVHPDDLEACYRDIQDHIEGRTPFYENVHRMRHRDGRWLYILDRGMVVEWDASGRPTRFTGTHTDITPQKTAELAARSASASKSAFLANMSHEVRTPLNGVLGVAQLLAETDLDEIQREYVQLILESGDGLLAVINDILDISKIEAGKLSIVAHTCELRAGLQSAVELFRARALAKGLTFEFSCADDLPRFATFDCARMRQILGNLVSNAVKFTLEGHVRVALSAPEGVSPTDEWTLRAVVEDTGIGMSDPDRMWDAFSQGGLDLEREFGGTGLGLTICRQLVHLMGGDVRVASERGRGTRFEVDLPVTTGVQRSEDPGPAAPESFAGLRVLVAEDNRVNQKVIDHMLRRLGIEPVLVDNGAEAVEACRRQPFDVVFLDLHMPRLNGLEAAMGIRALGGIDQPIVLALSADAMVERQTAVREAGMDGFLAKPVRIDALRRMLGEHVRR